MNFIRQYTNKKETRLKPRLWCGREDLNPHGLPLDPKSSASASSATPALTILILAHYIYHCQLLI